MDAPEHDAPHSDDHPNPTAAERLEASFAERIRTFASAARRVRAGSDPEAIHDLRVATRRLVAALRVWRSLVPRHARRDAVRGLRRLRRRIGAARELEVHVALLEARLPPRGEASRPPAAAILLRLKGRLARRRRAAARRVGPKRVKRMLGELEDATGDLHDRLVRDPAAVEEAMAVEMELAAAARTSVREAAGTPEDTRLHDARIAVKKWRYALECLGETTLDPSPHGAQSLRRMQRALGDVHDFSLLCALVHEFAAELGDERAEEALRPLLERLEGERTRAVRRFQRRAAVLLGAAPDADAGAGDATPGAPGTPPALAAGGGGAPDVVPHAGASAREDAGPADGAPGAEPREQRWDRMARWLEQSGRGG